MISSLRSVLLLLVLLTTLGPVAACETPPTPPPTPPPPPPHVRETSDLSAGMRGLADDIARLQELTGGQANATRREATSAVLSSLEKRVGALQATSAATAHPLIRGDGLAGLLGDIETARLALRRSPPDIGPARDLSSSCRECHRIAVWTPPLLRTAPKPT